MELLHPAMWHVALESWERIHQVAAPCSVIRGSGMTCHGIRPNVRHIGRSRHVILHQSAKFIQNGPPSAEKMTSCRFSRWRISAILNFRGPIMGSLKSPCTTSYRSSIDIIALNCLVFEKIAFLQYGDRQTNKQTNRRTDDTPVAWSRSRCRERLLNK